MERISSLSCKEISLWSITESGRGWRRDGQERGQVGGGGSGQDAGRDDQGEDGQLGDGDQLQKEEGGKQRGVTGKARKKTLKRPHVVEDLARNEAK